MNKMLLMTVVAFASVVSFADDIGEYIENEKSSDIIHPGVTAVAGQVLGEEVGAMMIHAVKLQMAKYDRDMKTRAGREAWHGKLVRTEIDTNTLVKVEVYSNDVDGAVWRYRVPFKSPSVRERNSALKKTVTTTGVPARLAAARRRRQAEIDAGVTNVSVSVEAGK